MLAGLVMTACFLSTANTDRPLDFRTDIVPILTKAGCNTGACHGAAIGRGGFELSLYGGDPDKDYRSIAVELRGRRVNLHDAEQSLVLLKATESMDHGGGFRLDPGSDSFRFVRRWIYEGATLESRQSASHERPRLTRFRVEPNSFVIDDPSEIIRPRAFARFNQSSTRDVTSRTVFEAEDPSALDVDPETGETKVLRRGRHLLLARYLDRVVPIEIIRPLRDQKPSRQTPHIAKQFEKKSRIDLEVDRLLETLRIPPAASCSDAAFQRRVTLDLTGRLPTVDQVMAFQRDFDPRRRVRLVDRLLDSEAFLEFWTYRFAKLLRIRSQPNDEIAIRVYHDWLRSQIDAKTPYDEIAFQLLTATGDSHQVGPAGFYRTVGNAREQAEFVSELFMANRLRCANCHNHPLDRWTQDDYHGLAAVFAKVKSGREIKPNPNGTVIHPRTGTDAIPKLPGDAFLKANDEERKRFARWLIDPSNPHFAKAIVNRLWNWMMGRGLVEPVDDMRLTNPATHPELLDALAEDFVASGFQFRHTLRTIAFSQAYARSAEQTSHVVPVQTDGRFYSRAKRVPLEPEVLADAISDVLGVAEQYGALPIGTRAVSIVDPATTSVSLDVLGRCSREASCESSGAADGGSALPRQLHWFNGGLLNGRLRSPSGRLSKLLRAGAETHEIVDSFYMAALARRPTKEEREYWETQLGSSNAAERRTLLEDFVWGLLSSHEFTTNH